MKKVFLYAYDKQNLGDDLFIHTITKRYPKLKFYIWTDAENKKTYNSIKNIKVIDKESLFVYFLERVSPSLKSKYKAHLEEQCDALVYIGGSIFIEYENWEQYLTWWDYEAKHRCFYVLGANFGPYKTEAYKKCLSEIFRNMKDVCFRDRFSYNLFSDIPTVRCAPDILFGIEMPKRKNYQKRVFVSVIDCKSKDEGINILSESEEKYLSAIFSIVQESLKKGYEVILSSFCKAEGDERAIDKLLLKFSHTELQSISTVNYNGTNSEEILQTISDSDHVVASRFHAMVLGFAADKPVFPIVYSDKTINVLSDVGFKGDYWDLRKGFPNDLVNNFDNTKQLIQDYKFLKEEAEKHFKKLDLI